MAKGKKGAAETCMLVLRQIGGRFFYYECSRCRMGYGTTRVRRWWTECPVCKARIDWKDDGKG